jgi:hypothetical protein
MKLNMTRRWLCSSLVAMLGIATAAAPAHATTTVVVNGSSVPANVSYLADSFTSIDWLSNYGVDATCASMDFEGHFNAGQIATVGAQIGSVSLLTSDNCTMSALMRQMDFFSGPSSPDWPILLAETPTPGQQVVEVVISDVSIFNVSQSCNFLMTGDLPATLDLLNHTITFNALDSLEIDAGATPSSPVNSSLSTCGGEFWDGDLMSVWGAFYFNADLAFS